jgi:hypothetical protein
MITITLSNSKDPLLKFMFVILHLIPTKASVSRAQFLGLSWSQLQVPEIFYVVLVAISGCVKPFLFVFYPHSISDSS